MDEFRLDSLEISPYLGSCARVFVGAVLLVVGVMPTACVTRIVSWPGFCGQGPCVAGQPAQACAIVAGGPGWGLAGDPGYSIHCGE